MLNTQILFTFIGIIVSLVGYIIYFSQIKKHKIKPHAFTWFIWAILMAIIFFAQIKNGGGIGSYVVGFNSLACFIIAFIAFFRRKRDYITSFDWVCLFMAILGILIWIITNDALTAVILATIIDLLGFIPTVRKSYYKPYEENSTLFSLGAIKFIFNILALQSFNLINLLYPITWVILNILFVIMLFIRRKK